MFSLLFRQHRARLVGAATLSLLAGLCGTLLIGVLGRALESGADAGLGAAFAAAVVLRLLFGVLARAQFLSLSVRVLHELRLRLARAMVEAPLDQLEGVGPQRLTGALTDDVRELTVAVTAMAEVLAATTTVLGALAYLAWRSWPSALVTAAMLLLGLGVYATGQRLGTRWMMRSRAIRGRLFAILDAIVSGIREIKQHRGRRRAILDGELGPAVRAMHAAVDIGQRWYGIGESTGGLVVLLTVAVVVTFFARGDGRDQAMAIIYLQAPMTVIFFILAEVSFASVVGDQLAELGLMAEPATEVPARASFSAIDLRAVTRSYEGGFVLGPLDLELRAGEVVFLVGGNGSGKSTLGKVLAGLYAPTSGEILLDGEAVDDAGRASYRELFGAVFFEGHVFRRLWGVDPQAIERRGPELLAELDLAGKTTVHEGGFTHRALSAGQRKRLALAGALLEDRPIYLFDEWTAEQDPEFRDRFYRHILPGLRRQGKTLVVISHDDAYFDVATKVVRMEHGQIVEIVMREGAP